MDADRFDNLARSLTMERSRRRVIAALGGVLGSGLGLAALGDTAAKKTCPPCKKRKQGKCKAKLPDGTACGDARICQRGQCVASTPVCAAACPGCCAGEACETGDTAAVCGAGGEACRDCTPDGACCGGSCCEGCCRDGTCKAGRSEANCGRGGVACTACAAGEVCSSGSCRAARCGEAGGPCTVFVTGTESTGNLGGLSGADATCQARASAAGLDGTYKAWLSDAFAAPATRFVHAPGPYRLVDGTPIADDWADLTDGTLRHAIDVDEAGTPVAAGAPTWTGTSADGALVAAGNTCTGWTTDAVGAEHFGDMGTTARADLFWSWEGRYTCSRTDGHLFCFQQD